MTCSVILASLVAGGTASAAPGDPFPADWRDGPWYGWIDAHDTDNSTAAHWKVQRRDVKVRVRATGGGGDPGFTGLRGESASGSFYEQETSDVTGCTETVSGTVTGIAAADWRVGLQSSMTVMKAGSTGGYTLELLVPLRFSVTRTYSASCSTPGTVTTQEVTQEFFRFGCGDTDVDPKPCTTTDPDRVAGATDNQLTYSTQVGHLKASWDLATKLDCTSNEAPSVGIYGKPKDWRAGRASRNAGVTMRFNALGNDPEGLPLTYTWLFSDRHGTVKKTGASVSHRWRTGTKARERVLSVTATDACRVKRAAGLKLWISGDPTRDFAPSMRLHPSEKYWPMAVDRFIEKSALRSVVRAPSQVGTIQGRPAPDKRVTIARRGSVDSAKLGSGGYKYRNFRSNHVVASDDYTRPYDAKNAWSRIPGNVGDGLYLDLANSSRDGSSSGPWPVYLHKVGSKIVYWQFYGFSQPMTYGVTRVPAGHEGDWERVIVDLNGYQVPEKVGYVAHHEPVHYLPYLGVYSSPPKASDTILTTVGLSPVGYVALGGHGTYPNASATETCVVTKPACLVDYRQDGGKTWVTRTNISNVTNRSWFGDRSDHSACRKGAPMPKNSLECGYGGAWGYSGGMPDATGPLGPSAYKSATTN